MQHWEPKIEALIYDLRHNTHPCSVMADQVTQLYLGNILCTQIELSDDEVVKEMEDGLDKANIITLEELNKEATSTKNIPTAIMDSRASTACVQPVEEQMQKSEYVLYTWDGPLNETKKSATRFSR